MNVASGGRAASKEAIDQDTLDISRYPAEKESTFTGIIFIVYAMFFFSFIYSPNPSTFAISIYTALQNDHLFLNVSKGVYIFFLSIPTNQNED